LAAVEWFFSLLFRVGRDHSNFLDGNGFQAKQCIRYPCICENLLANMRDRRTLIGVAAASATVPLLNRVASAQTSPKTKNVVFVHGLFADGSCWSKVIARLQQKGINCTSVQNPLTSLREASEATRRAIAAQSAPTVLVGHSFSGMIVSEVGLDPKVTALVYVAARAPDAGEDYTALAKNYPTPPATAGIVFNEDWGQLS
jgi:pimeloyl-ACP methyl ester carboxylesterase